MTCTVNEDKVIDLSLVCNPSANCLAYSKGRFSVTSVFSEYINMYKYVLTRVSFLTVTDLFSRIYVPEKHFFHSPDHKMKYSDN